MGECLKTRRVFDLVELQCEDHVISQGKPDDFIESDTREEPSDKDVASWRLFGLLIAETEKAYHICSSIYEDDFADWETRIEVIMKNTVVAPIKKHATIAWPPERD